MEIVHPLCCGLDIHKRSIQACLVSTDAAGRAQRTPRQFGTMTSDILALAAWLREAGCPLVAMESTGVYWKPIWNLLEEHFSLLLVNAAHLKRVPGRKSDVKDAEWLADLVRHGLVQGSVVPTRPERELRELTRYRTTLVRERAAELNRLEKTLEGANIKLAAVASQVLGKSGRAMIEALIAGEEDPAVLADLAQGQLRHKLQQLHQALRGRIGEHQRFLLEQQLLHIDALTTQIETLSAEIERRLTPFAEVIQRLDAIPGVGIWTAQVLVAELGTDLGRFPSSKQLASWVGMCPGLHESGGKRQSGHIGPGNNAVRTALVEAGFAASRSTGTYLRSQYQRLKPRIGHKRAVIAVGHSILVAMYSMLTRDEPYRDLGADYLQGLTEEQTTARLVRRLERMGNQVTITPVATPTAPAAS
jgi:transposase